MLWSLVLGALAACSLPPLTTPRPSGGAAPFPSRARQRQPGEGDDLPQQESLHGRVAAFWIPSITIEPDLDLHEPQPRTFDADLEDGRGFGLSAHALGDVFGAGLVLLHSEHHEPAFDQDVQAWALYAELLAYKRFQPLAWLGITPSIGFGAGGALFDFQRGYDDEGSAAGMGRARLGFELFEHVEIAGALGAFLWGYPGETIGYGGFAAVEFALRF